MDLDRLRRNFLEAPERFARAGMTWEMLKDLGEKARLPAWDLLVLFTKAKAIPINGMYLEIGALIGGSLCCVWQARQNNIDYRSIDPFCDGQFTPDEQRRQFQQNVSHITRLQHVEGYSHLVADQYQDRSVDLLFVDGAHDHESAKKDFLMYWPKIKIGGKLLLHDFNEFHIPVVRAALETFALQEIVRSFRSSMAVIKRPPDNPDLYVVGETYGVY